MAKIKFLEKENKNYKFLVENTDYAHLNFLRRMFGYNLPIYAIDEIDFIENDSVIVDEMLANRIGLVPIKTPLNTTGKKITFTLEKEGPATVYSKDLVSNDNEVKVVYDTIPLTKINKDQKVRLDAFAILDKGREHIKYSPAIISYKPLQELEIVKKSHQLKDYLKDAPEQIKVSGATPKLKTNDLDDLTRSFIENSPDNCLKLIDTNNYILNIELIGQIEINDLVKLLKRYFTENINILKKKIK